jgi:hypothetical protein
LTLIRDDVAACIPSEPTDEVARRIDATPYGFALALSPDRVVFGRVRRSSLTDTAERVEALIEPGPSTIRPHTPILDLAEHLARTKTQRSSSPTPRECCST